jgi:AraC-like DNA-binding protein
MHHISRFLRRGLALTCRWELTDASEAVERAAHGQKVGLRSVTELALVLGCSQTYLFREASKSGISLGRCMRWITLIRALSLRERGLPWSEVALGLGFSSTAGLSNFVCRLTGLSLTASERTKRSEWVHRLLEELHGDPRPGVDVPEHVVGKGS